MFSKDKMIVVKNIVMEPLNQETIFYIHGYYQKENEGDGSHDKGSEEYSQYYQNYKGVVVKIDFSKFHPRECKEFEQPTRDTSDYEYWSPHSSKNKKCLMGHRTTYIRKKPMARCFNPDVFTYIVK